MKVSNPYRALRDGKLTRENFYRRLPHRCCRCQARRTLARRWSLYIRPPKCRVCGYARLKPCFDRLKQVRRQRCKCEGYHFPHRRGSRFCEHNPQYAEHQEHRHQQREERMRL